MDIVDIAAKLFIQKVNAGDLNLDQVKSALQQLLPTNGSEIDVAGLVAKFASEGGDIAALASSWLGDGANKSISASTILDVLGQGKVSGFADQLGLDTGAAANGLSDMIPELIDKGSEGGSLVNDVSGALGKKLLGGLF